ncbi:hypothetical protein EYF80_062042 [Liparis tanakae]|uniref:Uncharacterized protein n=1 Tax=Liparis tanakae TaxID=230148 RepID=A0A4Z2EGZ3_9TELE|nr:hypothetical protein EYF80_062042 [Liparis tanakae]
MHCGTYVALTEGRSSAQGQPHLLLTQQQSSGEHGARHLTARPFEEPCSSSGTGGVTVEQTGGTQRTLEVESGSNYSSKAPPGCRWSSGYVSGS